MFYFVLQYLYVLSFASNPLISPLERGVLFFISCQSSELMIPLEKLGDKIMPTNKARVTVTLPPSDYRILKESARLEGISVSSLIRRCIYTEMRIPETTLKPGPKPKGNSDES